MKTCVFSSFPLLTLKFFEKSIKNCFHQCHYWWTSSGWCVDPITFSVVAPRKISMPQALAASLRSRAKEVQGFGGFSWELSLQNPCFFRCINSVPSLHGFLCRIMRMDMIYDYREQYIYIYNIEFHVLQGAAIEQLYEYSKIKFIYALKIQHLCVFLNRTGKGQKKCTLTVPRSLFKRIVCIIYQLYMFS